MVPSNCRLLQIPSGLAGTAFDDGCKKGGEKKKSGKGCLILSLGLGALDALAVVKLQAKVHGKFSGLGKSGLDLVPGCFLSIGGRARINEAQAGLFRQSEG